MKKMFAVSVALVLPVVLAFGCKKDDQGQGAQTPSASVPPGGYPPGYATGYPTGGYPTGGYPTATGYPTGTYPTATGYPTAPPPTGYPTAPPATATMATPGPLALPCTSNAQCGLAKCNTQFQKCAFPCQNTDADCIQGAMCNNVTGLCLPKAPGQ